jgi:hypothetical protein
MVIGILFALDLAGCQAFREFPNSRLSRLDYTIPARLRWVTGFEHLDADPSVSRSRGLALTPFHDFSEDARLKPGATSAFARD